MVRVNPKPKQPRLPICKGWGVVPLGGGAGACFDKFMLVLMGARNPSAEEEIETLIKVNIANWRKIGEDAIFYSLLGKLIFQPTNQTWNSL
jgi:hypothetical protein